MAQQGTREREDVLRGVELYRMFSAGTAALEQNVQAINSLNVFPVPDGDTGTNMLLTMRAVLQAGAPVQEDAAGEVAAAMARGAVLGARGNSGVILSQFFRGFAQGLQGQEVCDCERLAAAFAEATDCAYRAVSNPVEGTILTCIREASLAAQEALQAGKSCIEVWDGACCQAAEALSHTPEQLPILKQAGVVDAGGQGLCVILEGALGYLRQDQAAVLVAGSETALNVASTRVSEDFLSVSREELYGYCTQFMVSGVNLDPDRVREEVARMAASAVVVGDDTLVKVHVHAYDPGPVISYGATLGTLAQVSIVNMDEQHQEFQELHRGAAPATGVVAVALGDGMVEVLQSLGAAAVVVGGQTMNPSTQELLDAADGLAAPNVILLPNNKNIVPVAQQVNDLSHKAVSVVPTTSVPQGIAALLAFNPDLELASNLALMERVAQGVRTGEVTHAVRATSLSGLQVREGQAIGLLDGELVVAGEGRSEVVLALVSKMSPAEGSIVTLYRGLDTPEEEAHALGEQLQQDHQGIESEVVYGGQPHYEYIISVE